MPGGIRRTAFIVSCQSFPEVTRQSNVAFLGAGDALKKVDVFHSLLLFIFNDAEGKRANISSIWLLRVKGFE